MPSLLCKSCAQGKAAVAGTHLAFAASDEGEPAEYVRYTPGIARQPTIEQKTVHINGRPVIPPEWELAFYVCDLCGAEIRKGDQCCGQTVWLDGQQEPGDWESEFLERV